jgi:hypothetical protein
MLSKGYGVHEFLAASVVTLSRVTSVRHADETYGLAPSTVYKWRMHYDKPASKSAYTKEALK